MSWCLPIFGGRYSLLWMNLSVADFRRKVGSLMLDGTATLVTKEEEFRAEFWLSYAQFRSLVGRP